MKLSDKIFIYRHLDDNNHLIPPKNAVWAIGNFDGVHKGHQSLLQKAKQLSIENKCSYGVISFEPHPREFFQINKTPFRLTNLQTKLLHLTENGVEHAVILNFNQKLASMQAEDFVKNILVDALKTSHLVIGDDFKFGTNREGNFNLLKQLEKRYNFNCTALTEQVFDSQRVSSGAIRQLLIEGNVTQAAKLIGQNWCIIGRVREGKQLARTLGYPTANILPYNLLLPKFGVYKAKATLQNGIVFDAIVNVGIKPTIGYNNPMVEVHLLDFSGNLYGQKIKVEFLDFIRTEQKFSDLQSLKQQIQKDILVF